MLRFSDSRPSIRAPHRSILGSGRAPSDDGVGAAPLLWTLADPVRPHHCPCGQQDLYIAFRAQPQLPATPCRTPSAMSTWATFPRVNSAASIRALAHVHFLVCQTAARVHIWDPTWHFKSVLTSCSNCLDRSVYMTTLCTTHSRLRPDHQLTRFAPLARGGANPSRPGGARAHHRLIL